MPILTKSAKFYKSVIKLARFSKQGGGIKIQVVPPNQWRGCRRIHTAFPGRRVNAIKLRNHQLT